MKALPVTDTPAARRGAHKFDVIDANMDELRVAINIVMVRLNELEARLKESGAL